MLVFCILDSSPFPSSIPHAFQINFNSLYTALCEQQSDQATLLLYTLLHQNSNVRTYVLARTDMENLVSITRNILCLSCELQETSYVTLKDIRISSCSFQLMRPVLWVRVIGLGCHTLLLTVLKVRVISFPQGPSFAQPRCQCPLSATPGRLVIFRHLARHHSKVHSVNKISSTICLGRRSSFRQSMISIEASVHHQFHKGKSRLPYQGMPEIP